MSATLHLVAMLLDPRVSRTRRAVAAALIVAELTLAGARRLRR